MGSIGDHALIGDCRSAALVSRRGSIDWLCWPRFDSPSFFGALLDERAGRWQLAPAAPARATRRYLADTQVLETRFELDGATVVVLDFMPVASEEEKRAMLVPDHQIARIVRCERGEADVEMELAVRPDYGQGRLRIRRAGRLGIRLETAAGLMALSSDFDCDLAGDTVRARFRLRAGEERHASLTFADAEIAVLPPVGEWTRAALVRTVCWWRRWVAQLSYDGPHRDEVVRSALALRAMVYAPSGAVVAAPTTSLPERMGGNLNWDYRFCWLRDASLTMRALFGLGFAQEAEAFLSWLLHSTRLSRPRLRVLYDVFGKHPGSERDLGLHGFAGSRPVRIGNAAVDQLQLDVYGEVIDATAQFVRRGNTLDAETRKMLCGFGEFVCRHWRDPDEGIWEPRTGRAPHTHSRVLCWTALDRLAKLARQGALPEAHVERFERERDAIRRAVLEEAWNPKLQSYVAVPGTDHLDAAVLRMSWYGIEQASSPRMRATYARIRQGLSAGDGLLYRYRGGLSPGEGAFGICCFWAVEHLALGGGPLEEAEELFRELLGYANDVGLYAEEIDPSGGALGNFPQAFTHVGLINAALTITQARAHRREPRAPAWQPEVRA